MHNVEAASPLELGTVLLESDLRRTHITSLLTRYPEIDEAEKSEILDFLQNSPALEPALLTCDETIFTQLAAFRFDHRRELGFQLSDYLSVAFIITLFCCFILIIKDTGLN